MILFAKERHRQRHREQTHRPMDTNRDGMNLEIDWHICVWYIYIYIYIYTYAVLSCSHIWLFMTPWTAACHTPLSIGILQARILEWVAMPSFREYSQPGKWTRVSCIASRFFNSLASRELHTHTHTHTTMYKIDN